VFAFDGVKAPAQILPLKPNEGELLNGAAVFPNGFSVFSVLAASKIRHSVRYMQYAVTAAGCTPGARGALPSLADTDDATVPAITR